MWNWFNCYLSGRHEYGPWCEPGTIFLRCVHCGKRSAGWALGPDAGRPKTTAAASAAKPKATATRTTLSRVLPFGRIAVR